MSFRYAGDASEDVTQAILLAQALPGEIPLEHIQGTLEPGQRRMDGLSGGDPFFGGPMTAAPTPKYVTDIPIKARYSNMYGTDINAKYNPTTGEISASADVPIGPAENGYRVGVEGGYTPGVMDQDGFTPPAGYRGMIRFSRRNPIDPKVYEQPGREKFAIEAGVDATSRREPARQTYPVELLPGPGLY